jgi:SAM-dependent methyltransferase
MTRSGYDQWAEAYATANAQGFFNTWYEKPAMLRLLGDVRGKRVLAAGCVPVRPASPLSSVAPTSAASTSAPLMIEIARRSLPESDLRVHDLAQPLPWKDATFDTVVASLVLHYLPDWSGPLSEIQRVLTPGGRLLVSVNHPGAFPIVYPDLEYFGITEYTEGYDFAGTIVDLTFFHRPLSAMAESFAEAGYRIAGIHEPPADPDTPADVLPPGLRPGDRFMGFSSSTLRHVESHPPLFL